MLFIGLAICCLLFSFVKSIEPTILEANNGEIIDIKKAGEYLLKLNSKDPINTIRAYVAMYSINSTFEFRLCKSNLGDPDPTNYPDFITRCKANSEVSEDVPYINKPGVIEKNHLYHAQYTKEGYNYFILTINTIDSVDIRVHLHASIEIGDGQTFYSSRLAEPVSEPFEISNFEEGCEYSRTFAFFTSKPKKAIYPEAKTVDLPVYLLLAANPEKIIDDESFDIISADPNKYLAPRIKIEYMFSTPTAQTFTFTPTTNKGLTFNTDLDVLTEGFEIPIPEEAENEIGWMYVKVSLITPPDGTEYIDLLKKITEYQFIVKQQTYKEESLLINPYDFTSELGYIPNLRESTLYGYILVNQTKFTENDDHKQEVINDIGYRSLTLTSNTEDPHNTGSIAIMINGIDYPSYTMTFKRDDIKPKETTPNLIKLVSGGELEITNSMLTDIEQYNILCDDENICKIYVGLTFLEHNEIYLVDYKGYTYMNDHLNLPTVYYSYDLLSVAKKDTRNYELEKVYVENYCINKANNYQRDLDFTVNFKTIEKPKCIVSKAENNTKINKELNGDYFIVTGYQQNDLGQANVELQTHLSLDSNPTDTDGTIEMHYVFIDDEEIGSQVLLEYSDKSQTMVFREDAIYYGAVTVASATAVGKDISRKASVRAGITYKLDYNMEVKQVITSDKSMYVHFDPERDQNDAEICATINVNPNSIDDNTIEVYISQESIAPGYHLNGGYTFNISEKIVKGVRRLDYGQNVYCATLDTIVKGTSNEVYGEIVLKGMTKAEVSVRVGDAGIIYQDVRSGFYESADVYIKNKEKENFHIMHESQDAVDPTTSSTGFSVSQNAFIKIEYDIEELRNLYEEEYPTIKDAVNFSATVKVIKGTKNLENPLTRYILGELTISSIGSKTATTVFKLPRMGSSESQIYVQIEIAKESREKMLANTIIQSIGDSFRIPFKIMVEYVQEGYSYGVAFATKDYTPIFHRVKADDLQDLAFAIKRESGLITGGGTKSVSIPEAWVVVACPQQPAVTTSKISASCYVISNDFKNQLDDEYKTWVLSTEKIISGYWWFTLFPKKYSNDNPNGEYVEEGTGILYDIRQVDLLAVDSINPVVISNSKIGISSYNKPVYIYDILFNLKDTNIKTDVIIGFNNMGDNLTVYISPENENPIMPILKENMGNYGGKKFINIGQKNPIKHKIMGSRGSSLVKIYITVIGAINKTAINPPSIFVGEYLSLVKGTITYFKLKGKSSENSMSNKKNDRTGDSIALFYLPLEDMDKFRAMDITVKIEPNMTRDEFHALVHNKEWSDSGANYFKREPENLITTFITNNANVDNIFPNRSNAIFIEETRGIHAIDIDARKLRPTDSIDMMYIRVDASQYIKDELEFKIAITYTQNSIDDTNLDQLPFDTVVKTKQYIGGARDYSFIDAISVPLNVIISPCQMHPDAHLEVYISPYTSNPDYTNYEWKYNGETDGDEYDQDIVLSIPGDSTYTDGNDFSNMLEFLTITGRYDKTASAEQKKIEFNWQAEVAIAGSDFRPTLPSYNKVHIDFDSDGNAMATFRPSSINDCRDFPEVCVESGRTLSYALYRIDTTTSNPKKDVFNTACGVELAGELISDFISRPYDETNKENIIITQSKGSHAYTNRDYIYVVVVYDSNKYENRRSVYKPTRIQFTGSTTVTNTTPLVVLGSIMLVVGIILSAVFIYLYIRAKRLHNSIYKNLSSVI